MSSPTSTSSGDDVHPAAAGDPATVVTSRRRPRMDPIDLLHRVVSRAGELPGVRQWRARLYDRRFAVHTGSNIFRGVYASFEEAERSAPGGKSIGYDNDCSAAIYADRLQRIMPSDYPAMYWLDRLFAAGCRTVLDAGGNVGNCYYAYSRYLNAPKDLHWIVNDVPAVLDVARRIAREHDRSGTLRFVERIADADAADILLANGAIQFLSVTAPELIGLLKFRPAHLIINRTPLHPKETYFTLQSIGSAFCPYRIESEASFVTSLSALGYEIVDRWRVAELTCEIPFHPKHSIESYTGFYLELRTR